MMCNGRADICIPDDGSASELKVFFECVEIFFYTPYSCLVVPHDAPTGMGVDFRFSLLHNLSIVCIQKHGMWTG